MSTAIYPLAGTKEIAITPFNPVQHDQFEAGNSSSHLLWAANNFKRTIKLSHMPLTLSEWKYLRSFYTQRSGGYDSFWWRDNPNRSGNYNVRFAAPVAPSRNTVFTDVDVTLEEIAPIRSLPEFDEVITAAGTSPFAWYDANQSRQFSHAGTVTTEATLYDAAGLYTADFATGSLAATLAGYYADTQQYSRLAFIGSTWAKSPSNVAELVGAQPACTIFAILRQSSTSSKQILVSIGQVGTSAALGLALAADNRYEPWVGGSETWTNARFNNSAVNTWRSVAITWADSSNTATLYVNAASVGADSVTRSLSAGRLNIGAAPSGSVGANPSNAMAHCDMAHLICVPAALTLAQIKAVHNLLGYQYGLATVA